MKDFREIIVWQRSHLLTLEIYRSTRSFPREELYGLTSQLRRCASSIPTRIAEGCGRDGDIELLIDLCDNILGRSFCALGDGATSPITSGIKYFRNEFTAGMSRPSWELFPPEHSMLGAVPVPAERVPGQEVRQ